MKKGFTITELLIVISVIGILASILVVSYSGVRNRANDNSVRSDLDNAAGLLESYRVSTSTAHEFPDTNAELATLNLKVSKSAFDQTTTVNFVYCIDTSDYQAYGLAALSKSGSIFLMTEEGIATSTLTKADFASSSAVCTKLGQSVASGGMYAPGTWQTWVGGS